MYQIPNRRADKGPDDAGKAVKLCVVLPLSRPALTAVAIFLFLLSWNDFMWPLIVTNSDATRTLPVGLATFLGGGTVGGQSIALSGLKG